MILQSKDSSRQNEFVGENGVRNGVRMQKISRKRLTDVPGTRQHVPTATGHTPDAKGTRKTHDGARQHKSGTRRASRHAAHGTKLSASRGDPVGPTGVFCVSPTRVRFLPMNRQHRQIILLAVALLSLDSKHTHTHTHCFNILVVIGGARRRSGTYGTR